jgi:hypothetical protein
MSAAMPNRRISMLALLVALASSALAYGWMAGQRAAPSPAEGPVRLVVDYGNGTRSPYEASVGGGNVTLFLLTARLCRIEYRMTPMGAFITSINGLPSNSTHAWLWYRWDRGRGAWSLGEVASDKCPCGPGEAFAWQFARIGEWPPKPPEGPPPQRAVSSPIQSK